MKEKPPPPRNFKAANVQTRYFTLTWDQPKHGSNYQIDNFTVEIKKEPADSFEVVQTLPYKQTETIIRDLEPATKYTLRLSTNNVHGKSDGILLTQATLPGK